jgi:hypothetical protein
VNSKKAKLLRRAAEALKQSITVPESGDYIHKTTKTKVVSADGTSTVVPRVTRKLAPGTIRSLYQKLKRN